MKKWVFFFLAFAVFCCLSKFHIVRTSKSFKVLEKQSLTLEHIWIDTLQPDFSKEFNQLPSNVKEYLLINEAERVKELVTDNLSNVGFEVLREINKLGTKNEHKE